VQSLSFVLRHSGSPRVVFLEVLLLVPAILAVAWLLFITVERRTLRSSGAAEPGSPEALLLAPLAWLPRRRASRQSVPEIA
jgi:hypothetical protein